MSFPMEEMIEWAVKDRAELKVTFFCLLLRFYCFSSLLLRERLPQIIGERGDWTGA